MLMVVCFGRPVSGQAVSTEDYYKNHGDFQAEKSVVQAGDWETFISAYKNETVTKIVLTADIEDESTDGAAGPTNYQRKASIEIDGQGHLLSLKRYHGLRTSEKATGYTEDVEGARVPRSVFHMHDISLRQNMTDKGAFVGNYSSYSFVGASGSHTSWNLGNGTLEQNMTKNWYFRFGNIDTKQDENEANALGVTRLVMAYSAEVSVYGQLDLSTSAENMYVGFLIVEDGTTWTGVTEAEDCPTVFFAIAGQPKSTGQSEALTIGKNTRIDLTNNHKNGHYPGFYGHYKEAVIDEDSHVRIGTKGIAWEFDQDESVLAIKKGASLELSSSGQGKVLQFGRGFIAPKKIRNSHLVVESGAGLIVKGSASKAEGLGVIDFTGGLPWSGTKALEATDSSITVEKGGLFDVQNLSASRLSTHRRGINLRNDRNIIRLDQSPVYLWGNKESVADIEQEAKTILPINNEYLFKGEGINRFVADGKAISYANKDYRRISTALGTSDDFDGDGLTNEEEKLIGSNPNHPDTDGDGVPDGVEWKDTLTDPTKPDSEGAGVADGQRDSDGDGVTNVQEVIDGTDPGNADTDGDDLSDSKEKELGTDPLKRDTDEDGLSDGDEIKLGLDPLTPKTDGQTLDSERKVQQQLSEELVNDQFFEESSTFVPSLSGNVAKVLDKQARIEVSSIDNFDSQRALVGHPIELETSFETAEMTLAFDLSKSNLAGNQAKLTNLVIMQHLDNSLKPIETVVNGTTISATITSGGVYLAVDNALLLKSMGLDVLKNSNQHKGGLVDPNLQVEVPSLSREEVEEAEASETNDIPPAIEISNTTWKEVGPQLASAKQIGLANQGVFVPVDIVFVVDRTTSMNSSINNVKNNLNQFVDELTNVYNVQANFGMVTFYDDTFTTASSKEGNNFFTNVEEFKGEIGKLTTRGSRERVTGAIMEARKIGFKSSKKYLIVLTDSEANFNKNDPTIEDTKSYLERDEISTSFITTVGLKTYYNPIISQTDGIYANIYGNFSVELLKIAENIGEGINDGKWVLLSDFQAVQLSNEKDKIEDADEDNLSNDAELGELISKDMTPFIELVCKANGIPIEMYQGKKSVEVYDYLSNPVLADTDYELKKILNGNMASCLQLRN